VAKLQHLTKDAGMLDELPRLDRAASKQLSAGLIGLAGVGSASKVYMWAYRWHQQRCCGITPGTHRWTDLT